MRNNSYEEAISVKNILRLNEIDLKILHWKGKKPKSNIQSLARKNRYELLFNECTKSNIKVALFGHHQEDIYETFFSRLLRGSGTEGLSSFSKIENRFDHKNNKIRVFRPLLNLNKQDLIYISKKVFKFYIKDPSNEQDRFQRVRIRKLILNLKNEGLDLKKLNLTINNLASTTEAINEIVEYNIRENVTFLLKNKYLINAKRNCI